VTIIGAVHTSEGHGSLPTVSMSTTRLAMAKLPTKSSDSGTAAAWGWFGSSDQADVFEAEMGAIKNSTLGMTWPTNSKMPSMRLTGRREGSVSVSCSQAVLAVNGR